MASDTNRLKIHRIILTNWRNFKNIDIELKNRVFIIGANASGKSNLLDVFRFLRDLARGQGGGLQKAITDRGGLSKIRCYAARTNPLVELEIQFSQWHTSAAEIIYKLGITQETRGSRRPVVKYEQVIKNGEFILKRPDAEDGKDSERLTETHLEQTSANKEFREIASFFNSVCYLHLVPQMIRTPESVMTTSNVDDPFGRTFLERLAKTPERTRENRLKRIEKCLQIIAPQLKELKYRTDAKGQPHLEAQYEHWRPDAGIQNELQFSDGTLRAIGLLWALQERTSLLLVEEPELSLNSEIVKQLPGIISKMIQKNRRQMLISTHSFDLLADKGIAAEELVILQPDKEGTSVRLASNDQDIVGQIKAGFTIAESAFHRTAPMEAEQLSLRFDE